MPTLPVYTYGTSILRKKAKPVETISDEIISLIWNMFDTMHNASGIGLAANQVGEARRILVADISEMEGYEDSKPLVVINPEIIFQEGRWEMEEGCLSIPDIRGKVERAEKIIMKFRDVNFQEINLPASGLLARVILHEIDHLNGVLFPDHLPREEYKQLLPHLKDIERGIFETEYETISALKEKKRKRK
ncbi:MAG: peptide deformylase [Ignavibacteriales bacterium]|nr:peptide deformylase [Ignavibacteriales bacterium]